MPSRAPALALAALLLAGLLAGCASPSTPPPGPAVEGPVERFALLGDSISRGYAALPEGGNLPQEYPALSWGTGSFAESVASRLLAGGNLTAANVYNNARSGATMTQLLQQATQASVQRATHVAILMGANDLCRGDGIEESTPPGEFETAYRAALAKLAASSAKPRIFVASLPNVTALRLAFEGDSRARTAWETLRPCPAILNGEASPEQLEAANRRMAEYNAILARGCAATPGCTTDGGALHRTNLTRDFVSEKDFFHPSAAGQRATATLLWPLMGWAVPS